MVSGRVVDLDESVGRVIYLEEGEAKEYIVPRPILADDNVDEVGVEFRFECRKDADGKWTGKFVRTGKLDLSPKSEFSAEECSPEFVSHLDTKPYENLFGSS